MKLLTCIAFLLLVLTNANTLNAAAQAGSLDTSFGTAGTTLVNFSYIVPAPDGMVVQSDGKIVSIAGGFSAGHKLVRLNTGGSLDPTFGGDGSVEFYWALVANGSTTYGKAYDIAIQNIGGQERIVVAGSGNLLSGRKVVGGLQVQRFMPDGSVDSSFGNNGLIVHNVGYALTLSIQADGKILTVGDSGKLVRLNVDGSLDTSFGSGGVVSSGYGRAIEVDASGGILVGGVKSVGNGNNSRNVMSVKRFLANGAVDTSFGANGTATADFGGSSSVWEVQIDLAGNIVAGGNANSSFAVARFSSTGQPDLSFNGTGRSVGPAGAGRGMALQSDGKPVITGQSNDDFRLARFNIDGSLDTSFGTGGVVTIDVYERDFTNKSVIQLDPGCNCEKIVMSGGRDPYISFARFTTF